MEGPCERVDFVSYEYVCPPAYDSTINSWNHCALVLADADTSKTTSGVLSTVVTVYKCKCNPFLKSGGRLSTVPYPRSRTCLPSLERNTFCVYYVHDIVALVCMSVTCRLHHNTLSSYDETIVGFPRGAARTLCKHFTVGRKSVAVNANHKEPQRRKLAGQWTPTRSCLPNHTQRIQIPSLYVPCF